MRIVKLLLLAALGYGAYEAYRFYGRHRATSEGPAGGPATDRETRHRQRRQVVEQTPGPVVTGGGGGARTRTLNKDGEAVSTVVGRGVVSSRQPA